VVWRAQDGEGEDRLGLAAFRWRRKGRWIILSSSGRAVGELGMGRVGAVWCVFFSLTEWHGKMLLMGQRYRDLRSGMPSRSSGEQGRAGIGPEVYSRDIIEIRIQEVMYHLFPQSK